MRCCKQLCSIITMIAVLALPMAMMGCADQSAAPTGGETAAPAGATADPGEADDIGKPEGGSALP